MTGNFTHPSPAGLKSVTQINETKRMTCRYAHKRVALLFTAVQVTPAVRVIDWPQKASNVNDPRIRAANTGKSQQETAHANK
jgi:hypothetical protein